MIMPGSKENSQKYSHFNNYYLFNPQPLTTDPNSDEKGCLTASKLIKESEKHNIDKKLLWFLVLFILWLYPTFPY
jgi:hypothetical protein